MKRLLQEYQDRKKKAPGGKALDGMILGCGELFEENGHQNMLEGGIYYWKAILKYYIKQQHAVFES